jgi:hypothetical protein
VIYGFGDALGPAFGASAQAINADHINFHYGQWIAQVTEEETSNWRELGSLVAFVKDLIKSSECSGFEFFIFTDNSTAEGTFWKGTSTLQ